MMSTLATIAQFGPGRAGHRGGGLLALVLVPVIVALVAYGIYLVTRGRPAGPLTTVAANPVESSTARRILDERFARGEIDSDTYLRQVDTLRVADAPRFAPTTEVPAAEAPTTEVPAAEVPVAEAPTTEVPAAEAPATGPDNEESPPAG